MSDKASIEIHDDERSSWWARGLRQACNNIVCKSLRLVPVILVFLLITSIPITAVVLTAYNARQLSTNGSMRIVYLETIDARMTSWWLEYCHLFTFATVPWAIYVNFLYVRLISQDPGATPLYQEWIEAGRPGDGSEEDAVFQLGTTCCRKCAHVRFERTHHCSVCDICVDRYDHHCPWINNCVGRKNLRNFIRFLFWIIASLLVYAPTAILFLWLNIRKGQRAVLSNRIGNLPEFAALIWATAVIAMIGGVGMLLIFNTWLIFNNGVQLDIGDGDINCRNALWTWYRPNLPYSKGSVPANVRASLMLRKDSSLPMSLLPDSDEIRTCIYMLRKMTRRSTRKDGQA